MAADLTALPPGFTLDPTPGEQTYSPLQTVGLNVSNPFGAGGAIRGIIAKLRGQSYDQARDQYNSELESANEQNPIAHRVGQVAGLAGETLIGGGVGKLVGLGAGAAGVASKLAPWAEANPILSKVLEGVGSGAAYGAASGAGEAASKGEDVGSAAATGAASGGVVGGALGGVLGKVSKYVEGAPEAEEKDILGGWTGRSTGKGGATPTAIKRALAGGGQDNLLKVIEAFPALKDATYKTAAEQEPIIDDLLNKVGSKLDPNYQTISEASKGLLQDRRAPTILNDAGDVGQKAGGGGLDFASAIKQPMEKKIRGLSGAEGSEIKQKYFQAVLDDMKGRFDQHSLVDANGNVVRDLIDGQGVVPETTFRKYVTQKQTAGQSVIDGLNPGEQAQVKIEMGGFLKDLLDQHMSAVAIASKDAAVKDAVKQIGALNPVYRAGKALQTFVDQRLQKEGTNTQTLSSLGQNLLKGGGAVAALPMALHGNIPGAVATVAGSYILPKVLPKVARGTTAALATLQRSAAAGNARAAQLLTTIAKRAAVAGASGAAGAAAVGTGSGPAGSVTSTTLGAQ